MYSLPEQYFSLQATSRYLGLQLAFRVGLFLFLFFRIESYLVYWKLLCGSIFPVKISTGKYVLKKHIRGNPVKSLRYFILQQIQLKKNKILLYIYLLNSMEK